VTRRCMNKAGAGFSGNVIATSKDGRSARIKRVLVRRANNVRAQHGGKDIKAFALGKLKFALRSRQMEG